MGGREKKSKRIYRTSQNIRIINVFTESLLSRVLSHTGSHSSPHLPRMPFNTVLISGPAVGAAQILIWSYSSVFLPPVSTVISTSAFSSVGLSMAFYIFQTQRLPSWSCGFNLQPVQPVGSFGSSSLATLPLGFNCGFISTSACGSSTGACSWGCPGGLGSVPVRARCGGGAAAWVAGVLAAPGTQGVGG